VFGRENEAYHVTAAMTNQLPAVLISSGLFIWPAIRITTAIHIRAGVDGLCKHYIGPPALSLSAAASYGGVPLLLAAAAATVAAQRHAA